MAASHEPPGAAWRLLLRPEPFALALVAIWALSLRSPGGNRASLLWLGAVSLAFAAARALHIHALIREGRKQQLLLEEIAATRQQLAEKERRAGTLEERQRLARDLHDTLAQGLAAIVLHLEAGEQALPSAPATAQHHLAQARRTARENLNEVRGLLWALPQESQGGVGEAIARLLGRFTQDSGIDAVLEDGDQGRQAAALHPAVQMILLRAAQEGLANVRKHAAAQQVRLRLSCGEAAELELRDDGIGFARTEPPTGHGGGFGLRSMAERAAALGGTLEIDSAPGRGTVLRLRVPLAGPAAAGAAQERP